MAADEYSDKIARRGRGSGGNSMCGGAYGIAFIGAAIYWIGHATSFWMGVLGFLKALFWPGVLLYKVLEMLNM